jgi:hypothetical protein
VEAPQDVPQHHQQRIAYAPVRTASFGGKLNAVYACPPMAFRMQAAEMLD